MLISVSNLDLMQHPICVGNRVPIKVEVFVIWYQGVGEVASVVKGHKQTRHAQKEREMSDAAMAGTTGLQDFADKMEFDLPDEMAASTLL